MLTAAFFDSVRSSLFSGSLNPTQVGMLNALDKAWSQYGDGIVAAEAYVMATVYNELSTSLISRAENLDYSAERAHAVWPSKFKAVADAAPYAHNPVLLANHVYAKIIGNHDEASGDGWKFRGRGPSQITGRANYTKFSQLLGLDLINYPDLALDQETGAAILVIGMVRGLFTGKKLSDYFGRADVTDDPVHARAIVNGDVAVNGPKIAANWNKFLSALRAHVPPIATAAPGSVVIKAAGAGAEGAAAPLKPNPIIQAWQERLQAVAKAEGQPDPLPVWGTDGFGGDETRTAILSFQTLHPPLAVTGQFDDATRAALEQHPKLPPIKLSPIAEFAIKAAIDAVIPPSPAKDFIMLNFGNIVHFVVGLLPGLPDDVNKIRAVIAALVTDAGNKDGIAGLRDSARFARVVADELDKAADALDPSKTIQPANPLINK